MATSAGLRSGFDYDLEYGVGQTGLAEFEPESERDEVLIRPVDHVVAEARPSAVAGLRMPGRRWMLLVPLTAAAIAMTAIVSALAMRDAPLPALPGAPAPWPRAEALVGISMPDVPNDVAPVAPPRTDPETPKTARIPTRTAVDDVLAGLSQSYRRLDAASLQHLWPGADTVTLSKQFSRLKYQALSFDRCDVRPVRGGQMVASCAVSIAAVLDGGDPTLHRRHESWSVVFDRSGDRYVIGSVAIR